MRLLAAWLAAGAALWAPTIVGAQTVDAHLEDVRRVLRGAEERGMNGVVLIRAANRELLHEAYGYADREAATPMRVEHGFDIGSLVKPITGVAIWRLQELGLVSPDDRLIEFFPHTPPDKADITIRQLLTHTSGLPDIFGSDYDVVSRDWVLERALGAELLGPPGEAERYSNVGYSLLAMIIEDVSGMPYEAFIRQEVLSSAGTPGLGYRLAGWDNTRLAVGYRGGERWGTPLDHPWADDGPGWNLRGNGGMLGTAEEMARWYEALFDGRILSPEAAEAYLAYASGESGTVGGRGLAHAGGNGVFNTLQVSWIDHDVHMTFFTSTSDPLNAETVWRDIRDDVIAIGRLYAEGGS